MSTPTVTLRDVTMRNVRQILKLKVAPDQQTFVADNATSLAEAHFVPHARFWAIYADESPVGFMQIIDDAEKPEYYLWRFMIDAAHQRHGYGRRALQLLIDYVRTRPNATGIELSFVPAEGGPEMFYRSLGFVRTGAMDGDEVVARLDLTATSAAPGANKTP
jgi:diamine N-acetyltransferase